MARTADPDSALFRQLDDVEILAPADLFDTRNEQVDLASAKKADTAQYAKFFHGMLERGFLLPPAQFEAAFVSMAHTLEDIQGFVTAAKEVLTAMKEQESPPQK